MHVLRQMRARQRIVGLKADKEKVVATAEIKPELAHKREVTFPPPPQKETIFLCVGLRVQALSLRLSTFSHFLIVNKTSLSLFLSPYAGARAPRGGVTRQSVVLTDLQPLLDSQ